MRKALFIFFILCSSLSHSHDYYFSFAEVEYDEFNGRIEATISMTTHDFERYLQQNNIVSGELNNCIGDSAKMEALEIEINKHFHLNPNPFSENSIADGDAYFHFNLEGFETQLTGIVQFYLSTQLFKPLEIFDITYDLLMDQYPEQQNKLTFIYRGQKKTYVFLNLKRSQIIDLY